jgi:hypothetical protein
MYCCTGNFDPEAFDGLPNELQKYGLILTCIYMMVVVVLMLNLLIALMGDSFAQVAENGLAQWRLEQTMIILANADSTPPEVNSKRSQVIYLEQRKTSSDFIQRDAVDSTVNSDACSADTLSKMETMMTTLMQKQNELQEKVDQIITAQKKSSDE